MAAREVPVPRETPAAAAAIAATPTAIKVSNKLLPGRAGASAAAFQGKASCGIRVPAGRRAVNIPNDRSLGGRRPLCRPELGGRSRELASTEHESQRV